MKKIIVTIFYILLANLTFAQTNSVEEAKKIAKNGDFKQALLIIDKIIATNPPKAIYYQEKAYYCLELKDYDNVLKTLELGISIMPDSVSLYNMRGGLFESFMLYKEAILDFTKGYEKSTNAKSQSNLLSNRGGTKSRLRDFEGAYIDLKKAAELDSLNMDALNNLAAVCDEVNKPNETLKYLELIITLNPNYVPAYVNIGFKYQILEQHEKAIIYFNKAIELSPDAALGYSNRSFSRLKVNDLEGATKDINQSLTLMPINSYAYKIKALIEIKEKKYKDACNNLHKALELGYTQQYGNEVEELILSNCKK